MSGLEHARHDLDAGNGNERYRRHWYQLWMPSTRPAPPPASLADASMTPLAGATFFSVLTYAWLTPLMTLGWQRTLQAPDLWRVQVEEEAGPLSQALDEAWARRVEKANLDSAKKKRPFGLSSKNNNGPSLALALNDVLGRRFWVGGVFKVIGDVSQLMAPLLTKAIIQFAQERSRGDSNAPHIGRGIGLAFGLPLLTICASVCTHQFFWRSMCAASFCPLLHPLIMKSAFRTTGVAARAALIASLYSRGLRFGPGERQYDLVNHVSTDVSRIGFCAQWFHAIWTAPIQILGPAALAGFSLFAFLIPIQKTLMSYQLRIRKKSMVHTDSRASLLRELLGSMKIVKVCAYEAQFEDRLEKTRKQELRAIRSIVFIKAAVAFAIPTLAAVLSFVTYAATHDEGLDPAVIFPSMALFQMLRQPLMFLPRALSSAVDAKNALSRLKPIFLTKTIDTQLHVDLNQKDALVVENAEWVWCHQPETKGAKGKEEKQDKATKGKGHETDPQRTTTDVSFRVADVSLNIPRGSIVGIAGPVGSGKSSLLLGLLGEMPQTRGRVSFGGKTAYCSQMAWIQNATLVRCIVLSCILSRSTAITYRRETILFLVDRGTKKDTGRLFGMRRWRRIWKKKICREDKNSKFGDSNIGPALTDSARRVNIARALYDNAAEIFLLDDPLSAVDAHVGHALFHNAILNNLKARGKTVLLVTHALHFLPAVDHVYTLERFFSTAPLDPGDFSKRADLSEDQITLNRGSPTPTLSVSGPSVESGRIAEQGTYEQLLRSGGAFAKLVEDFGNGEGHENGDALHEGLKETGKEPKPKPEKSLKAAGTGKLEGRLIKAEKPAQGCFAPRYSTFNQPSPIYMVGYAALGLGYAVFALVMYVVFLKPCLYAPIETPIKRGIALGCLTYESSKHLYRQSLSQVFHAPMSFFDTTVSRQDRHSPAEIDRFVKPLGRILGVFGKDVDIIFTISSAITSVVMITILEYYFASARELKRLDSNLRSLLYSHFSESLTGLATIRAYGEVNHFLKDNTYYIDLENRALFLTCGKHRTASDSSRFYSYLTIANQRWLAIRLDFLGSLLVFSAGVMSVVGIHGISPSEIGLVLVSIPRTHLKAIRRDDDQTISRSSGDIPQEKPYLVIDRAPPKTWPTHGEIEFRDLVMSYRPGLPPVLRGVSLHVRGGEKIGVVGRTGAGKSSLMAALFRIVELTSGSILIDGLDIGEMGLSSVRSKIAIIPQEAGIFSGTIRSNMDPFGEYDDATLHDALRRSHLLGQSISALSLDSPITAEGANLSVGQRSLLSFARALVKQSRVLVLDEATASVDLETDSKIQATIKTEFSDRTILCIAHRLRTIINYDRVVVMDQGQIVEVGAPLHLFSNDSGIFRSMCDQSGIDAQEIIRSTGAP
ncbi:ATP-binding cassette transporter protein YOR1 [Rhizoctonia solani AG-1 IA]|uniref:ATP-binding cassette transporter protein YOR1 n=1 Tax=Thanatephorus cucumeris (strain AG1-IA) TaxID=983506 RepID=L8WK54_THACA|nr:ATP-binding cassette transporter protein YOR1 [Rhizoctonia solani AG-1 IA]